MGQEFLDNETTSRTLTVAPNEVVSLALVGEGVVMENAKAQVYWATADGERGPCIGTLSGQGPEAVGVLDVPGDYIVDRTPGDFTVEIAPGEE